MLPGYNHNVQYKGRIFHIQTEDSGVQNPHIITLLYYGGNIIARKKTSYEDILNSDKLTQVVKEMMQEQHKAMLRDLKSGVFDERIKMLLEQPAHAKEAVTPQPQAKPSVTPPPPSARPHTPPKASSTTHSSTIPPKPVTPSPPPSTGGAPPVSPRPTPPQPQKPAVVPPPSPPPSPPLTTSKLIELSDDIELKDEDIFGADLISDKSLDEVILSYLAQNLEEE